MSSTMGSSVLLTLALPLLKWNAQACRFVTHPETLG